MENKSILKKIVLIAVLVIIAIGIILVVLNASSGKKEAKTGNANTTPVSKSAGTENSASNNQVESNNTIDDNKKAVTKKELADGILYTLTDEEITPEIIVGDNYFDTQIADMNLNFDQYEGKTIEIEGLYFENSPYTFVGRYSLANLCLDCPAGYSYFEYEWHGEETPELEDEENWIKLVGTLRKGNDGIEYYYIDVASLKVMNEKGLETVSN